MSCPPMRITKRSLESALQSYDFSAKYANLTALLPAVDRYEYIDIIRCHIKAINLSLSVKIELTANI